MIPKFSIARTPEIIFGAGRVSALQEKLAGGSAILLCTGSRSFSSTGVGPLVMDILDRSNITFEHIEVTGEPTSKLIDEACGKYRGRHLDAVVAIGGGSVLDAGKAISAMLTVGDSVLNYLEDIGEKQHPGSKVMFIAVPTTAGTGSEVTKNAVLCDRRLGYKKSLRHDNFIPDIAIVDPALHASCPPGITVQSGLDALSQLVESYTSTKANPLTDALAVDAIRRLLPALPRAVDDGSDLDARAAMAYAAMVSGITLANAGLGLIHGLASTIGGMFDVPHGIICGTLLGKANEKIVEECIAQGKQEATAKFATLGGYAPAHGKNREHHARHFAGQLLAMVDDLRIPRLAAYNITASDFDRILADVSHKNNPVTLSRESLLDILSNRL